MDLQCKAKPSWSDYGAYTFSSQTTETKHFCSWTKIWKTRIPWCSRAHFIHKMNDSSSTQEQKKYFHKQLEASQHQQKIVNEYELRNCFLVALFNFPRDCFGFQSFRFWFVSMKTRRNSTFRCMPNQTVISPQMPGRQIDGMFCSTDARMLLVLPSKYTFNIDHSGAPFPRVEKDKRLAGLSKTTEENFLFSADFQWF